MTDVCLSLSVPIKGMYSMNLKSNTFCEFLEKATDSENSQRALKIVKYMETSKFSENITGLSLDEEKCLSKALVEYFDHEGFVDLHSTEGDFYDIEADSLSTDIEKSFDYIIQD